MGQLIERILRREEESVDPVETLVDVGSRGFVDRIAPAAYEEGNDWMRVGDVWMRGYYVADLPAGAQLDAEGMMRPGADTWVSMFIQPLPPETAATLHRRKTELMGTEMFDARRGSMGSYVRKSEIGAVDEAIREYELGGRPIYHFAMYMAVIAASKELLDEACQRVEDLMASKRVAFYRGKWMQPQMEYSLLPAGTNRVPVQRNMTAGALGAFFPFTRQVYYEPSGFPYGVHATNGTWVILNPFAADAGNSSHLILGRPRMGKSAYMKRYIEIAAVLGHRVFVVDLENEYQPLIEDLGGTYITLSRDCAHAINVLEPGLGDDPFDAALSHLLGFMGIALGRKLSAVERRTVIPSCYHRLLETMKFDMDDPSTWDKEPPTLDDLQRFMEAQSGEAKDLARLLYPYTSEKRYGHLFSRPTNIDLARAPVVGFSLKGVGEDMLAPFMWVVMTLVWQEVTRAGGVQPVDLLIDEGYFLLRHPDVAQELGDVGRRFPKYQAALHLATHFAEDLVRSEHAQVVRGAVGNVVLFGQQPEEAKMVGEMFGLSSVETRRLESCGKGDALLIWNGGQFKVPIYVPLDPRRRELFETGPQQRMEQALREGVRPTVVE